MTEYCICPNCGVKHTKRKRLAALKRDPKWRRAYADARRDHGLLLYKEGLSYNEIGLRLGLKRGGVATLLYWARFEKAYPWRNTN